MKNLKSKEWPVRHGLKTIFIVSPIVWPVRTQAHGWGFLQQCKKTCWTTYLLEVKVIKQSMDGASILAGTSRAHTHAHAGRLAPGVGNLIA